MSGVGARRKQRRAIEAHKRAVANKLMLAYQIKHNTGFPLGAPYEQWERYREWVAGWLRTCREMRALRGERVKR